MNGHIPATQSEQRRGNRFRVVVPLDAIWKDPNGNTIRDSAEANEVNGSGGLLAMKSHPEIGAELQLVNAVSGEQAQARVTGIRRAKDGKALGVAVELIPPSETFWGVNFELKKTSAQLSRIEEAIKSGGVDHRILRDFRDAVDYVRKTAWAVQEWQERQLRRHDPQTVVPLIISERIRRATQLGKSISTDLNSHDVTQETAGIKDFFGVIETLRAQITALFKNLTA